MVKRSGVLGRALGQLGDGLRGRAGLSAAGLRRSRALGRSRGGRGRVAGGAGGEAARRDNSSESAPDVTRPGMDELRETMGGADGRCDRRALQRARVESVPLLYGRAREGGSFQAATRPPQLPQNRVPAARALPQLRAGRRDRRPDGRRRSSNVRPARGLSRRHRAVADPESRRFGSIPPGRQPASRHRPGPASASSRSAASASTVYFCLRNP